MRWSATYIPTLRERQSEAELISHQYLLRGGYIRRLASGVYLYLPLMQRVIDKFANIVREEMNRAGALEITMSVLCPAELWQETGRFATVGKEQMRMHDRHEKEMVLCGTHEETVTDLVRGEIRSYKQLPLNLYQIQVKFRDEIRPRFGLMRGREFLMKDAYTFDADEESFANSYQAMVDAYFRIFERAGISVEKVESDTGAMGGKAAHEFMLLVDTNAGEETIIVSTAGNYAANVEKATFADATGIEPESKLHATEVVDTPNAATIEEVSACLNVPAHKLVKTLIFIADEQPVAALIRGDRDLNEVKLKNALGCIELEMATPDQIQNHTGGPLGFSGPIGLNNVRIIVDPMVTTLTNFVVGANAHEKHIINVNYERDFNADEVVDITRASAGDKSPIDGAPLTEKSGIEVGNTFMLGTKYSSSLGATFLDKNGKEQPIIMGSYGVGITRTVQAVIEKYHDDAGIIWPKAIAPYHVHLIPMNIDKGEQGPVAETLYRGLTERGIEVLFDDRRERAGVKLNDADLLGLPLRIVIGDKSLAEGKIEAKLRSSNAVERIAVDTAVDEIVTLLETAP